MIPLTKVAGAATKEAPFSLRPASGNSRFCALIGPFTLTYLNLLGVANEWGGTRITAKVGLIYEINLPYVRTPHRVSHAID